MENSSVCVLIGTKVLHKTRGLARQDGCQVLLRFILLHSTASAAGAARQAMTMLITKVVVVAVLQASRTVCKRLSGTNSCTFVTPEERMTDRSRFGNIGSNSSSKRFVKTFCAADTEMPPPKVWLNIIIAVPMGIKSSGSTFCTAISGSCKPAPAP